MNILKRTFLPVLACASLALSAQLVEKASPNTKAKSKAGKTATTHAAPEKKTSTKGLDAFGITPRALATWKRSGAREDLTFKVVTFQRRDASDHGYPVYEMHGREVFDRSDIAPTLALVRVRPEGPEMSLNSGSTWVQGEGSQKTWAFAFDNQLITLAQLDEAFKPTAFKSMAFERGVIVQRKKEILDDYRVNPFFHSVVIALAYGRNEVEGILKFPGSSFVVPFKGIRFKDKWIARSLTSTPFNTSVYPPSGSGMNGADMGAKALRTDDNKFTQIEMNDQRLLLGTGGFLNYGVEGEPSERLETASEFELAKAKELPGLGEAFHKNFGRSLWTKTDEGESFSREAEKAFFQAGLKAWFWAPYQSKWQTGVGGDNAKKAHECLDPMLRKIQSLGGEFGLLDYSGNPPSEGQAPASPSRSRIRQSQSETAGTAIPKFPLEALTSQDRLISVHTPNEIRFWSSDMKRTLSRQALTPSELLTSAAISPDGHAFVTAGTMGVRMWNADLGQSTSILPMDGCNGYWCAAFSANGSMVAAGGKDGHSRIWDSKSGRLLGNTKGGSWGISFSMNEKKARTRMQNEYIASVAFSPDGKRFAEGAANGDVKVWDISDPAKPKKIKSLEMEDLERIWRLKFLHEGRELLVLNQTGSYRILDTNTWNVVRKADNELPQASSILYPKGDASITTSHVGGKVVRMSLGSGAIERDVTVEGVALGVLTERDGEIYLLGDEAWKPVGF